MKKNKIYQRIAFILFLIVPSLSWAVGYIYVYNKSNTSGYEIIAWATAQTGSITLNNGDVTINPGLMSEFQVSPDSSDLASGTIRIQYIPKDSDRASYCTLSYTYTDQKSQNTLTIDPNYNCVRMSSAYINHQKLMTHRIDINVNIP